MGGRAVMNPDRIEQMDVPTRSAGSARPEGISTFPRGWSIDYSMITDLYLKYADDLRRVRGSQRALYEKRGNLQLERVASSLRLREWLPSLGVPPGFERMLKPQLDDLEAEVSYLLLRELRPRTVVEISPDGGWSTTWLLSALRDNGWGRLHSFDLSGHCRRVIPRELAAERWSFVQGDVRIGMDRIPDEIDYLFLDSAHTAEFAGWYLGQLFPRLAPHTPVSIHDILPERTGEAEVVMRWLYEHGVPYFTLAKFESPPESIGRLMSLRQQLGLGPDIHSSNLNPMVFFRCP